MRILAFLIGLSLLAGCDTGPGENLGRTPSDPTPTAQNGPHLGAPSADTDGVLRILVYHDMEGLAGQDIPWTAASWWTEEYAQGRRLLTDDVNAVIDGLYAGGADEVHVTDAHGSGSPRPDLLVDELDERAEMIFRDEPFRPYVDLVEAGVYDAVAAVGMHVQGGKPWLHLSHVLHRHRPHRQRHVHHRDGVDRILMGPCRRARDLRIGR